MAKQKRNVDAYGKSWRPIDIANLEKAVKLYERLNYLNDHFAGSLSGANNIWSQINEKSEIQEELQKMGIKLTKEQCEEVIRLFNAQKDVNKVMQINTASQGLSTAQQNRNNSNSNKISLSNIGSSYQQIRQQKEANQIYSELLKTTKKKYGNISQWDDKVVKEFNDTYASKMEGVAGKYAKSAGVIQVAANTLKAGVDKLFSLFTAGLNRQSDVYENTFTNISVRNRITRSQYYEAQNKLNGTLGSMGLFNNVGSSEVMQMWDTLANQGIAINFKDEEKRAEATAKAIETVVTSKIVPYLDTTSASFQQFADQQPNLIKQVRGIGLATLDISGSSVVATKYLQDMVDNLSPMAAVAENELGLQYAEMTGQLENLRAQGYSDSLIGELYKGAASIYRDPLAALKSNNLDQALTVVNGITQGIDFRDASQVQKQYINGANFVANLTPEGYMSPIFAGATNSALSTVGKVEMNERNANIKASEQAGTLTAKQAEKVGNKAAQDLADDLNQTNKKLQDLSMENIANQFATMKEWMGNYWDVLITTVKGIAGTFALFAGGKALSALLGIGGSGSGGLLAALGGAGSFAGIALGTVAGVAAIGAIATAVDKGIAQNKAKTANDNAASYASEYEVKDADGNTIGDATSAGALASYAQQYGRDKNTSKWKAGLWDNLGSNFVGSLSNAFNWNGYNENDPADYNNEKWRRTWNEQTGHYDDEQMAWLTATYAAAIMDAGNDASIIPKAFNGANITPDGLKAFFHKNSTSEEDLVATLSKYASGLATLDLYPVGPNRQYSDYKWSIDDMKRWGMYRTGLNNVPYDDFPAILHENEAVLTASTANELRNLLTEYRETKDQSANIEAAITNQTTVLVGKMEEIIRQMQSMNTGSVAKAAWAGQISNSMKNMRTTKAF